MFRNRSPVFALAFLALTAAPVAAQQQLPGSLLPVPRLTSVSPSGAKAGTAVEVSFTGTDLEGPEALVFSHPGIKAEPVVPPPTPPADPNKPPAQPAPKPAVTKFKVTVAADVPLGLHDVRLVNKWGVSNPRAFAVGDLAEATEAEPNNDVPQAQRVALNTTVSGACAAATDVDYFVVAGKKGQRVVFRCLTSGLDSRLSPGLWVFDAAGKQLAFNRLYDDKDAVADVTLPADGDYHVRVHEFTYQQGSPEFFYRLSVSVAPWIDAVHPRIVVPGKPNQLTVYGRNLPGDQPDPTAVLDGRVLEKVAVTVDVPEAPERSGFRTYVGPGAAALRGFELRLRNDAGSSNAVLLPYARAPVALDNEANDTAETAQEVAVPCDVAGRVEKKRDRDWYAFTAKKGEVYHVEVMGDRLDSPVDMYMVLRNAATKQDVIESDDEPQQQQPNFKFFTGSKDPPVYRFVVPADGKYLLLVASRHADTLAGPRHAYRVRITPELHDFNLVVMPPDDTRPEACCLRQGGNEFYSVFALRQDGWNGEIALSVEGLPKGVTCPPQALGPGIRHAKLVLTAEADAAAWTGEVKVIGKAVVKGQEVVREARPATITWLVQPQSNVPALSRLDRGLWLAVRDKAPWALAATIDKPALVQGDKASVALKLNRLWPDLKQQITVQAQPTDLPPGLTLNNNQPFNIAADKADGTLAVNVAANVPPGTYNLVLRSQAQVPYNKDPKATQKPPILMVQTSSAVALTVLPKNVATVAVTVSNPNAKAATEVEVLVKVTRLFDYDGEFKVELVPPAAIKDVSAEAVTIPAGKDEAKVIVKIAEGAAAGNRNDLVLRATAVLKGNVTTTQEAKFNLNVVK